jgi:hypothetical protein
MASTAPRRDWERIQLSAGQPPPRHGREPGTEFGGLDVAGAGRGARNAISRAISRLRRSPGALRPASVAIRSPPPAAAAISGEPQQPLLAQQAKIRQRVRVDLLAPGEPAQTRCSGRHAGQCAPRCDPDTIPIRPDTGQQPRGETRAARKALARFDRLLPGAQVELPNQLPRGTGAMAGGDRGFHVGGSAKSTQKCLGGAGRGPFLSPVSGRFRGDRNAAAGFPSLPCRPAIPTAGDGTLNH